LTQSLLEIDHVSKTYRNGFQANDDISLSVDSGEVFGLLGPNGAGKTTLVGQVLGSVVPTEGSITIGGVDVVRSPVHARKVCSYQPQTSAPIEGLSPLQAIEIVGRIRGKSRREARSTANKLIERFDLGQWAKRTTPLSGGVARLVTFCMATVAPGQIVVLDEPTNDVDPLRRKTLWDEVRRLADDGSAVLLVTHNVLEAERCVDQLAIIHHGRVLSAGTPGSIKAHLGEWLRLEVVLDPAAVHPSPPEFLHSPAVVGRRLIGEVESSAVEAAVDWATRLRASKTVEEFSIGPITLEDIYVRQVRSDDAASELAEAGASK
jgi:ABC-2 type transport system ATP-binding protein